MHRNSHRWGVETLFNISWAFVGLIGIAAGLLFRRSVAPWGKRELVRDVLLLSAIVFLLLPFVSISDDIGYFSYYFSQGQAPDCFFWVSGSRREKQLPSAVVLQAFAFLLAATVAALCQRTVLGTIALTRPARFVGRSTTATYLRAPPSSLF